MRRLYSAIGTIGIAAILLTPAITALIAAFFVPRFVAADEQASAQVSLYEVVGTHASYDLASYVADFQQGLTSSKAAAAAARASGGETVPTVITSTRLGDSTSVLVTFSAPTARAAESGLRAATRTSLTLLASDEQARAEVEYRAVIAQLSEGDLGLGVANLPPAVRSATQGVISDRTAVSLSNAQARLVLAETVANSVDSIAGKQSVTIETLSTLQDRIRIVVAAAASSLVPVLIVVALLSRRADRRRVAQDFNVLRPETESYEPSLP